MKEFFAKKSLRGKINILTVITSVLAMFLVLGAIFGLNFYRYSKDELFKFQAQDHLLARTLSTLHPDTNLLTADSLDQLFASSGTVLDAYLEIGNERMPVYHRFGGPGPVDGYWPSFEDQNEAWTEPAAGKAHVKVVFSFEIPEVPRANYM